MQTLQAIDLARADDPRDDPWRRLRLACWPTPRATGREWITPAGFAFAEREAPPEVGERHVLLLEPAECSHPPDPPPTAAGTPEHGSNRRIDLATPHGPLTVEIEPNRATVGVEGHSWDACAAPVLLAIAVGWRLDEIETQLDDLTAWLRGHLHPTARPPSRADLRRRTHAFQSLLLDLPAFEGSLDDPSTHFAAPEQARLFRRLARRLGLEARRSRLDDRIEILEATLADLNESHRHRQALTWTVAIEALILLALLLDLLSYFALPE